MRWRCCRCCSTRTRTTSRAPARHVTRARATRRPLCALLAACSLRARTRRVPSSAPGPGADSLPSEVALNPLAPCGACMEWLKKIAEVNPDFKVITFSDTNCEHAFIAPIDVLS